MNKNNGRYRVSWEQCGCAWKSFTDDETEAIEFANLKMVVSDRQVTVYDIKDNRTIYTTK